jgi:hypothetical protein
LLRLGVGSSLCFGVRPSLRRGVGSSLCFGSSLRFSVRSLLSLSLGPSLSFGVRPSLSFGVRPLLSLLLGLALCLRRQPVSTERRLSGSLDGSHLELKRGRGRHPARGRRGRKGTHADIDAQKGALAFVRPLRGRARIVPLEERKQPDRIAPLHGGDGQVHEILRGDCDGGRSQSIRSIGVR